MDDNEQKFTIIDKSRDQNGNLRQAFLLKIKNRFVNPNGLIFCSTMMNNSLKKIPSKRYLRNVFQKGYKYKIRNSLTKHYTIQEFFKNEKDNNQPIEKELKKESYDPKYRTQIINISKNKLPAMKVRAILQKGNVIKTKDMLECISLNSKSLMNKIPNKVKFPPLKRSYRRSIPKKDIIEMTIELAKLWKKLVLRSNNKKDLETKE